jgi:hypothetical protein
MSSATKVNKVSAAIPSTAVARSCVPGKRPTALFDVHFTIEVEVSELDAKRLASGLDEGSELLVEEAVTALVDEELGTHHLHDATRCGLRFEDAHGFDVRYVEPGQGVRK